MADKDNNEGLSHEPIEKSDTENESSSSSLFGELAKVLPERDIETPEEDKLSSSGVDDHKSLTEREEESPNKSDVKIMTETLFPDMGSKTLNHLMVSEVFPESYRPLQSMLVKDRIKRSTNDESVIDIIVEVNTPESIAFGREGRFDGLAIVGVATKAKNSEESNKYGYGS